jgi:hypothetical protein
MTKSLLSESMQHERDTVITGDLTRPDWSTHIPQYACSRSEVTPGVYRLNAGQDAVAYAGVCARVPVPAGVHRLTMSCRIRRVPGGPTLPASVVVYRPSDNASAFVALALSDEWQELVASMEIDDAEAYYQVSITVNHSGVGSGPQAVCDVRDVRVRYDGGSSVLAGPFDLFDASRAPLLWGALGEPPFTVEGPQTPCQAHVTFVTDAPAVAFSGYSTLNAFPAQAPFVVRVNRSHVISFTPSHWDRKLVFETPLPGVPGTLVEVFGGPSGDHPLIVGQASDPIGTWIHNVYLPSSADTTFIRPNTDVVVMFIGASIVSGWFSSPVQTRSWLALLRDWLRPHGTSVVADATGWRPLHAIASTPAKRAAYIQKLVSSGLRPRRFVVHLQINDYALGEQPAGQWSAADYGAGYGAFLDDLHAAFPDAVIYCPSAEVRANEETPNAFGDTLQDYRDAGRVEAELRAPWAVYRDGTKIPVTLGQMQQDGLHPDPKVAPTIAFDWYGVLAPTAGR